jgi:Domain of unknown function (DUF4032)
VHPKLSRGQRQHDLDIMVENVAMGMVDLAERLGRPESLQDTLIAEAEQVRLRYDSLWELLHAEPLFGFTDRYRVEGTIRRLNELGFVVDELSLQPDSADPSQLKLLSPWATGATTRSTFRSSPAWTSDRDRPESCSAICAPIRRSCVARSGTTSMSRPPPGCGWPRC